MYKSARFPFTGCWISIRTWYQNHDKGPRWRRGRGRCKEYEFEMPFFRWQLAFHGSGKRYRELVGLYVGKGADGYVDWLLDEFDSSFNELACATLRYHMDYSVVVCSDERRARYQDIIDRLSERRPLVCATEEQREIYDALGPSFESKGDLEHWFNQPTPPEIDAIYDDYDKRRCDYHDRINKARHDFVDIMPELTS